MDMVSPPVQSQNRRLPRCRNFISTTLSSSFPSKHPDSLSIKPAHSYSSLKDLLPTVAVNSPKPKSPLPGSDICIRNRLVKQAAWAYLQPMSTSPSSTGGNLFHRFWTSIATFIDFLCRKVIRAVDGTLRVIRISPDYKGLKYALL